MKLRNVVILLPLLAAVVAPTQAMAAAKAKLLAVACRADWCNKCKQLEPKAMQLMPDAKKMGVQFVRLDLTNDKTKAAAMKQVAKLGIGKVVMANPGTGFILLIDPKSHEQVGKIAYDESVDQMKADLMKALGGGM